jgi:meso-butanediol dehydrogenase / (S,S)-butanediol dehydrogenase / diacetyl reductase
MDSGTPVALITGSSRGLGYLVARKLESFNWNLALCARNIESLKFKEQHTLIQSVDVSLEYEARAFVEATLNKFGRIDGLINDAGYCHQLSSFDNIPARIFQKSFAVNVYGPFYFMKYVIPIMKRQNSGVIINVASSAGIHPNPKLAAYSASKAALIAFTEAVQKDLKGTGINCYYIAPIGMNTPMRDEVVGDAELQQDPEIVARQIITMMVRGKDEVQTVQ